MAASPSFIKPRLESTRRRWRPFLHWRAMIALLILAFTAYIAISRPLYLLLELISVLFLASQIFWLRRAIDLGERLIPSQPRSRIAVLVGLAYLFLVAYSFPSTIGQGHTFRLDFERMPNIVADAAFWWCFVGSISGFLLVIAFGAVDYLRRTAVWICRQVGRHVHRPVAAVSDDAPPSSRREFLRQAAVLVSATPFVAAGYGLLYGREDVEVVRQGVRLARLPKAFHGFRIAQLSDIHMGPFASAAFVRRCVAITNDLQPDLVVLTGDFIAWDIAYVSESVGTLGGLHAPHGVFGCLGNHEEESGTEESITRLFAAQGIHILRQARAPIQLRGETLNLIGIDEPHGRTKAEWRHDLRRKLQQIGELMMPQTVNILLSHGDYPHMFDLVAEVGIDLMLAGHTHGGQLSLDFIHRGLNLSHLIYDYNSGWYEKNGAQLYVNRGIGTTGFPIRLGARPEITLLELAGPDVGFSGKTASPGWSC